MKGVLIIRKELKSESKRSWPTVSQTATYRAGVWGSLYMSMRIPHLWVIFVVVFLKKKKQNKKQTNKKQKTKQKQKNKKQKNKNKKEKRLLPPKTTLMQKLRSYLLKTELKLSKVVSFHSLSQSISLSQNVSSKIYTQIAWGMYWEHSLESYIHNNSNRLTV